MRQTEQTRNELLALGDLTGYGDLALRIAKRGGNVAEFMAAAAERSREKPLHDAADRLLGFDSSTDADGYSIGRAIRACMTQRWDGAELERSVSNLAQTRSGSMPKGDFFVPFGLLSRDFNAGTANQAGNYISAARGGELGIDPLRKTSISSRLGATWLMGCRDDLKIPRFDGITAQAPQTEIASAGSPSPTTSLIDLVPKRYPITLPFSKQAVLQSAKDLDNWFSTAFTAAIFESLDNDAINGAGTGAAALGIRATPNVGDVAIGTDGGFPTFALLSDVEDKPSLADLTETEYSGWVLNSKTRRYLRTLARGTNLDYCWQGGDRPLLGHRAVVSNIMPSNLTKGASGAVCSSIVYGSDWTKLIIACYGGGIDIMVDRITQAHLGKVVVTAALYASVGLARPQAFAKIDDLKTA